MKHSLTVIFTLLIAWGAAPPSVQSRDPLWELVLEQDERFPIGAYKAITGMTTPAGVRFIVNGLDVNQPVQATLLSESTDEDLRFLVFKDDWDAPRLEGSTGSEGEITYRFRTNDHAAFQILGPEGAEYQMFVWVGPKFQVEKPVPLITMAEYQRHQAAPVSMEEPSGEASTPKGEGQGKNTALYVLLSLILLALCAIFVLLLRGKKTGGFRPLFLLILFPLMINGIPGAFAPPALAQDPDLKPRALTPRETWERTNRAIREFRDFLNRVPGSGNKEFDDIITGTKLMFTFMEQFGLIDRREAAVQPNYNPDGMPSLPSRCVEDPDGKCRDCFMQPVGQLNKWHKLLEDQWVIYRQTMLEAGRIVELADAAAGMSSLAKFKWSIDKANPNDPANKAKAHFFAEYDKNYAELIKRLNDALLGIGQCEFEHFSDRDWYNRYGMPYYLFMRERYKRPDS